MISIHQYLLSVGNSRGLTRTLGELDLCRDPTGRPIYSAGNSAVVFKIRHEGRICALRCYTHPAKHLCEIYGKRLLREELFVYRDAIHGEWVDLVLSEWIEGQTLHECILKANASDFARLAEAFDLLAAELTTDDRAHGDLKPENIIVCSDGTMLPIDLDASFLPSFMGEQSPELGTAAFQHPSRTADDFNARLDDFPAALISTALHALAIDPSLGTRHGIQENLLINPQRLPQDAALTEILDLFERRGDALRYRIARLLLRPTLHIQELGALFTHTAYPTPGEPTAAMELFVAHGTWGYRDAVTGRTLIPALYDCGFDFTEELAAVQIGRSWHYIDVQGKTVIRCGDFTSVKPFREGRARVCHAQGWCEIDRTGKIYVLEY